MSLINRFLWHYWWGQSQYLRQRLDELEAEENNLIEDRRKVRARLMKAEARVITYAQIGGCEMKDLYRGDGGPLSSYDEGWNDGIEAAEKAIRAENDARRGVEADHELQNAFEDAVTRAEKAEAELAAIKAAKPSAISDETVKRVLTILMHEYPGIRVAIESVIAAAQEGK